MAPKEFIKTLLIVLLFATGTTLVGCCVLQMMINHELGLETLVLFPLGTTITFLAFLLMDKKYPMVS